MKKFILSRIETHQIELVRHSLALVFIWLVIAVPFLSLRHNGVRPLFTPGIGNQDFPQYYMPGMILKYGEVGDLYPDPIDGAEGNAGWTAYSIMKPGHKKLAQSIGVEQSVRFIQPPPAALLLAPLAALPFPIARIVWGVFMGFCGWLTCLFMVWIARELGLAPLSTACWTLFWGFSPLLLQTIRTANSAPLMACAIGLSGWGILRNRTAPTVLSMIVGALFKGTNILLVPILFFAKRWRIIAWGLIASILVNAVTIALLGHEPYLEFLTEILPTTRIPDPFDENISIFGLLYRLNNHTMPAPNQIRALNLLGGLCTIAIYVWIARKRALLDTPHGWVKAMALLLCNFLLFNSYAWHLYYLFLIPFWGIFVQATQSARWKKRILIPSALLIGSTFSTLRDGVLALCEPFQSGLLFGLMAIAFLLLTHPTPAENPS